MRFIAVTLAITLLAGCSEPDNKVRVTIQTEGIAESQNAVVSKAAEVLFDRCPALTQYAQDIEWVKARPNAGGYQDSKYGWSNWISFEVKVSDDARRIPADWRTWGHHLYYDVGGSPRPGVNVGKDTGGWFCGIGDKSGLIPAPDAVAVDQLRT